MQTEQPSTKLCIGLFSSVRWWKIEQLAAIVSQIQQEDYPVHSRVHPLRGGGFVKRDDELGGIFSGSKLRKYRTLIPALKLKNCKQVALIGGQHSNQIVGLSALLIENQIEPILFLLRSHQNELVGNALFTHLLVPKEHIHFINRADWSKVSDIAKEFVKEIIPEGGAVRECIGGLATLALDILRNEDELGLSFSEILIDAGTGITSASLIACFGFLKKEAHFHIMLAASTQDEFHKKVSDAKEALQELSRAHISYLPPYTLHLPPTAKAFGATNRTLFETIINCARREGFFLDPIYSAKLYLLWQNLLNNKTLSSNALFIHSGGVFSLAGFQESLHD